MLRMNAVTTNLNLYITIRGVVELRTHHSCSWVLCWRRWEALVSLWCLGLHVTFFFLAFVNFRLELLGLFEGCLLLFFDITHTVVIVPCGSVFLMGAIISVFECSRTVGFFGESEYNVELQNANLEMNSVPFFFFPWLNKYFWGISFSLITVMGSFTWLPRQFSCSWIFSMLMLNYRHYL